MNQAMSFLPSGTLRHHFRQREPGQARVLLSLDELLSAIALISKEEQFESSLVWLARRLVDLEQDLSESERVQVVLLTLALLVGSSKGNTRIRLDSSGFMAKFFGALHERLHETALILKEEENPAASTFTMAAKTLEAFEEVDFLALLKKEKLPILLGVYDGELVSEAKIPRNKPLIVINDSSGKALTSERLLRKEKELVQAFAKLSAADDLEIERSLLDGVFAEIKEQAPSYPGTNADGEQVWLKQELNDEQLEALKLASTSRFAMITGGPGTGKTTIVVSVLRALTRLGVSPRDMALAAPTGKAAYRMKESIDQQLGTLQRGDIPISKLDEALQKELPQARTLHRLLGFSPRYGIFRRNADDRLDAKVVICDESSMIDLDLMHGLIQALPDDGRLILVGDAQQLPSVGAGAIFGDLVGAMLDKAMPHKMVRLKKSYRMSEADPDGSRIYRLSKAIAGEEGASLTEFLDPPVELQERARRYGGPCRLAAETTQEAFLKQWFKDKINPFKEGAPQDLARSFSIKDGEFDGRSKKKVEYIFEHYKNAQILALTQVFKTGARAINRSLHKLFIESFPAAQKPSGRFIHLEPMVVLKNNYELNVFNGDQGVVIQARVDGAHYPTAMAVFPAATEKGYRAFALELIRDQIDLAYATSVHKAQGSEFRHVALVLPQEDMPLLTQELLYTAVTRASKSVTILDPKDLFEMGAAKRERRETGL